MQKKAKRDCLAGKSSPSRQSDDSESRASSPSSLIEHCTCFEDKPVKERDKHTTKNEVKNTRNFLRK